VRLLEKDRDVSSSQGLFTGKWGAVLYLFYYEQFCDNSQDKAIDFLKDLYGDVDSNLIRIIIIVLAWLAHSGC
jgi:hypothetical protein